MMPRRKGYICGAQTRKNMSIGALNRESRIIKRYGLTREFYDEQLAAGKLWCSTCKSFADKELFGNGERLVRCKPCSKIIQRRNYEKDREHYLARRKEYREAHIEAENRSAKDYNFSKYGIDREWYERTLAEQGGGCAICGIKKTNAGRAFFSIDHNHNCCKTKSACEKCRRGLLCDRCNFSLERVEAVEDWSAKTLAYLAKYRDRLNA